MKKKYYVWYKEDWDKPQRLAIFRDLEDFIDFIAIICTNRCYDICDVATDEIDDDEDSGTGFDSYERKFGEQYVKAKGEVSKKVEDFCYNLYRQLERKFSEVESLEASAERAAAWNIYREIKNKGEKLNAK